MRLPRTLKEYDDGHRRLLHQWKTANPDKLIEIQGRTTKKKPDGRVPNGSLLIHHEDGRWSVGEITDRPT